MSSTSERRGRSHILPALLLLGGLAACIARKPAPAPDPGAQCLTTLAERGVAFEPVAMPIAAGGCGIANGVRVLRTAIAWNQPAVMSCALAERLDAFERDEVQAAALRLLGQPIARIRHFGAYACRREASGRDRLSQHALGNAIDIAGFVLADGSEVTVAADWRSAGSRGAFLREVAQRACRYFSVVLTPSSNAVHHDHIHLDIGPYRACDAR